MANEKGTAPLIPLRDVVILPNVSRDLFVGRPQSLAALRHAELSDDKLVVFVTQRDERRDTPGVADLHDFGCLARIEAVESTEENVKKVRAHGLERIRVESVHAAESKSLDLQFCDYATVPSTGKPSEDEAEIFMRLLMRAGPRVIKKKDFARHSGNLAALSDIAVAELALSLQDQQGFLESPSVELRVRRLISHMRRESDVSRIETKYERHAKEQAKDHREDYLKEKAARIQKALGETNVDELSDYKRRVRESGMSEEAREKCMQEISRLVATSSMSPESSVLRNYVDVLLSLPWKERSELSLDLAEARRVLDEDHDGLDKVKERIIEYLAVQQLVGGIRGSVLCFLGPPGVGKTSLGRSIARATGRKFARISLGGVHDEATIRGHRRTYVASMPGRIMQAMADVKVKNPVFMLDEVEKLNSSRYNGDPMAALLEVIDPEQNKRFNDHYIEVDFDLSEVMFIGTANSTAEMYPALRDRMEFIELPGYTDIEKERIATRHLVPKQLKAHGIDEKGLSFGGDVLRDIIRNYTKEAGVRQLERQVAKVCRKIVLKEELAGKKAAPEGGHAPSKEEVRKMLGVQINFPVLESTDRVGIVNGLAVIGEWEGVVHQIDAVRVPEDKGVKKTGNLKPHIEQTIDTAVSIIRSNKGKYGAQPKFPDDAGVHIHYPQIDITHDGNSNGIAVFALLVSVINDLRVRMDTAMTGAINLRGEACAVGGIRAKLIGAWRERIARVLIPHVQLREIDDLPKEVTDELEIIPVRNVDEVLRQALVEMPKRQRVAAKGRKPLGGGQAGKGPPAGVGH